MFTELYPNIQVNMYSQNSNVFNYAFSGSIFSSQQSSGHLKSPTPPPPSKPPGLSRKQSMDLNQVSMLSPAAMSPASSSQSESRPKFSIKS